MSDDQRRIATDQAHHLCEALSVALGENLSHRRPGALACLQLRIARERAVRAGDATALAALGKGA